MTFKMMMMMTLFPALLAVSGCVTPSGNFCDVSQRLGTDAATARILLDRDRQFVLDLNVHNQMVDDCG